MLIKVNTTTMSAFLKSVSNLKNYSKRLVLIEEVLGGVGGDTMFKTSHMTGAALGEG